ncbi:MAG TPA: efflux RND transporter periplasmic adaptor subunit, partial [Longimicrobiales bacterium]|nr:efflux RND transporter periplasmic adaptor subunit [Longimicrobiales bacterium]
MKVRYGGLILLLLAALLAFALGACGRGDRQAEATTDSTVTITPENIAVVAVDTIQSGPTISGALMPDRAATIRAEVSGSVLQTYAEKGQTVARGALLARIDEAALRESFLSAKSGVRSAEQAAQVARRNAERAAALAEAGAISQRELEETRSAATNAEALLADAAARLSLAEKQLANTQIRAPFAGIVSDKPVSAGDVVSPGTALFTVVDPTQMKLEAAVPAAQLGALRIGSPVQFVVQGYTGRVFTGRLQRINPAADPVTRQVGVYVSLPNTGGTLVSGLYAEGVIGSQRRSALVVPQSAVDLTGATPSAVRLKNGKVERVDVQVGLRDEQRERIELTGGV